MNLDFVVYSRRLIIYIEAFFVRPIAVIPDLGGQPNGYFLLKDRSIWREDFESWLESPDETLDIPVDNDDIPRAHNREAIPRVHKQQRSG